MRSGLRARKLCGSEEHRRVCAAPIRGRWGRPRPEGTGEASALLSAQRRRASPTRRIGCAVGGLSRAGLARNRKAPPRRVGAPPSAAAGEWDTQHARAAPRCEKSAHSFSTATRGRLQPRSSATRGRLQPHVHVRQRPSEFGPIACDVLLMSSGARDSDLRSLAFCRRCNTG